MVPPIDGAAPGGYTWTVPTGATITSGQGSNKIMVDFTTPGMDYVCVSVVNACGEKIQTCLLVTVCPLPQVVGPIAGNTLPNKGSVGNLYTISNVPDATSYTWTLPAGATITSGHETDSIYVDFSQTASDGDICVEANNDCGTGGSVCLSLVMQCPVASIPTILAGSNVNAIDFDANWTAVSGANTYYLDVATDAGFTNFVSGFQNLNVGNVTSYNVTGLTCEVDYWYRVRAENTCGVSGDSGVEMVTAGVCCTPDTWTQKSNFGGATRHSGVGFSIGTKGYIGLGSDNTNKLQDFWEWDQTTDTWTQKADFGGGARDYQPVGFSIGNKGYVGTGRSNSGNTKDFWEYDPATNTWTQKADFGGVARYGATGFSIGTKGYIGTGSDGSDLSDFWEWDSSTDTWTQKSNYGGGNSRWCFSFSLGTKGYIGAGTSQNNQMWEWNPNTDTWTQMSNYIGSSTTGYNTALALNNKVYVVGGLQSGKEEVWEWDSASNIWTQKSNFTGGERFWGVGFTIGNYGYFGTGAGSGNSDTKKDFWEYCP